MKKQSPVTSYNQPLISTRQVAIGIAVALAISTLIGYWLIHLHQTATVYSGVGSGPLNGAIDIKPRGVSPHAGSSFESELSFDIAPANVPVAH